MSTGTITTDAGSVTFFAGKTSLGYLQEEPITVAEKLTTNGVDGARWRTVFSQFPEFELKAVISAQSYAAATLAKQVCEAMTHKTARLTMNIDGVSYTMQNVHVSEAFAAVIPGPMVGAGIANSPFHLIATWKLEGLDFL